jgi:hypothetical protein
MGSLDEVRVSHIARSAAWIATEFLNEQERDLGDGAEPDVAAIGIGGAIERTGVAGRVGVAAIGSA